MATCDGSLFCAMLFGQDDNVSTTEIYGLMESGKCDSNKRPEHQKIQGLCLNCDQSLSSNLLTTHVGMFVYVHLFSFVFFRNGLK